MRVLYGHFHFTCPSSTSLHEKHYRHHLPNPCRASWKYGDALGVLEVLDDDTEFDIDAVRKTNTKNECHTET